MSRHIYQGKFVDGNGAIVGDGTISVYLENGTTAASIYTAESGGSAVNSVTSDTVNGTWSFFVDDASYSRNQKFKVTLSKPIYTSVSYDGISIYPKVPASTYYVNDNEADQGAAGSGYSIKDIIDAVGSANVAIVLSNMSGSDTTTYTISTSETIPANIALKIEQGAIISIDSGKVLTVNGPMDIGLGKIFTGSGTVSFGAGFIREVYPTWWGASASESAANNATAFNACLVAAFAAGFDVYIPAGQYTCNPIAFSFSDNDFISGVKIYGPASGMTGDNDVSKTLLDFSGITTAQVGLEFENTGTAGGLVNLTLENLSLVGPGSGGSSIGINFKGIAGTAALGLHDHIRNCGVRSFYKGVHVTGTNNWGLEISDTQAQSCTIGFDLNNKSTIGLWSNVHAVSCTHGFRLGRGSQNQTFISPHAEGGTNGFVFDTEDTTDLQDIVILNPYFESLTGSAMLFGFDIAGSANSSQAVRRVTVTGGTWSSITGTDIRVTPGRLNDPHFINCSGIPDFISVRITGATQANPVVVTTEINHGLVNGDKVFINNISGMTEINDLVFTVANKTAATFELSGINGTGYTAYTSAGQVLQNDGWEGPLSSGYVDPTGSGNDKYFFSDSSGLVGWVNPQAGGGMQFGSIFTGAGGGRLKSIRVGSTTWNPASIANGAEETKNVTVTDAALGDFALASFSIDTATLILTASVISANTVQCSLSNNTGGAIDLGSGTVSVLVFGAD